MAKQPLYGIVGEFRESQDILKAAHFIKAAGYTRAEAYTPVPVEHLADTLGYRGSPVAACTLIAGIIGGLSGFGMCWYANVISYPWNIGGRPYNSWPAWIPITFEMTVLFAGLTAAISMIILNGLPRLHHPLFAVPGFEAASRDRFFLCIEARDPRFSPAAAAAILRAAGARAIAEVPA